MSGRVVGTADHDEGFSDGTVFPDEERLAENEHVFKK